MKAGEIKHTDVSERRGDQDLIKDFGEAMLSDDGYTVSLTTDETGL